MTDITFVRTRYDYASYVDYWRLVELGNYATCYVDEVAPHDTGKTYIVTPVNGEWNTGWPGATARIILWDLEWRHEKPQIPGVAEVWAADRWYAARIGAKFVPLGSHSHLVPTRAWNLDAEWDAAMLAYMTPRREAVAHALRQRGYRVAPNGWRAERNHVLRYSRSIVHVHQHEGTPTVAPQRFAIAAANATLLVSEACADPFPFRPGVDFVQASHRDLPGIVAMLLQNGQGRDMAAALWQRACIEYNFQHNVEGAL